MKQPRETPPTANDAAPAGRPEETQNRLKEILQVLARHDIVKGMTPEKLRNIVEDLGPTFVKLGQIMSMRQDMLPGGLLPGAVQATHRGQPHALRRGAAGHRGV